jgi:type II secretory pathway pseudopilin PulG
MSGTTNPTGPALASETPAPAVASHGSYSGQCIGANAVLIADIVMQELCNNLQVIYAQMATNLANVETAIQNQLGNIQQALWTKEKMNQVQQDIDNGGKLPDPDASYISTYQTQLGAAQAAVQAGTKSIDPVLTPTQNMPQAIVTSANEEMNEAGSVIQGISFLANCKIS